MGFRTKDYPYLAEQETQYREAKRLRRLAAEATRQGTALGHDLGDFEPEDGWHSAVTTCRRCHRLAAVDWTERPYLFGLVYRGRCGERITRPPTVSLGSMTVGEVL